MTTAQETIYYRKLKPILNTARVVGVYYQSSTKKVWSLSERIYSWTIGTLLCIYAAQFLTAFDLNDGLGVVFINKFLMFLWCAEIAINAVILTIKTPKLLKFFVSLENHAQNANILLESETTRKHHLRRLRIMSIVSLCLLIPFSLYYLFGIISIIYDEPRMYTMIPPIKPGSVSYNDAVAIHLAINIPASFYNISNYLLIFAIYCCICNILWNEFMYFNYHLTSVLRQCENSRDLEKYRLCYSDICNLVDIGDDIFSLYIANLLVSTLILFCLSLYLVLYGEKTMENVSSALYFLLYNCAMFSTVTLCSAKVNKEVSPNPIVLLFPVSCLCWAISIPVNIYLKYEFRNFD